MANPRTDNHIKLSDGRRLAYAEYGEANGVPVFLFHGLPGSRLCWGLLPNSPLPRGLRIIAPDRPGYGRSDPKPGRTVADWADDVAELADSLDIEQFAVVGISGGGPGTLACAWRMPERLTSVGVVASAAPPDAPNVFEGMSRTNRFFMKLAWRAPWVSDLNTRLLASIIRRNPARYLSTMKYKVHDVDKVVLARPEIREMLMKDFAEALRHGADGMVADLAANHGQPWGFRLDAIESRVMFWYCELDRSVPPAMGKYLSTAVPDAELRLVPNAGHLWILEHLHDVLTELNLSSDSASYGVKQAGTTATKAR